DLAGTSRAHREERWWLRRLAGEGCLRIRPGEQIDLCELPDFGGFKRGWSVPDDDGIWTVGTTSQLSVAVEGSADGEHELAMELVTVCVADDDLLPVTVLANGQELATRAFAYTVGLTWRIALPQPVLSKGVIELCFIVADPQSPAELGWSDD